MPAFLSTPDRQFWACSRAVRGGHNHRMRFVTFVLVALAAMTQSPAEPDWRRVDEETLRHFQELVRFDTTDPPGKEAPAVDYLKSVLEREGIAVEVFATEAHRPNLLARLKGSGKKRPL